MVIVFLMIGSIAMFFVIQNRIEDHLESEAQSHANDVFVNRYYDTKRGKPYQQTLELKDHRLIHRNRGRKTTINLYQIKGIHVWFYGLNVELRTGKTVRIPLRFERLPEIYAILKYHRPDENRTAVSTRST